jgi:RNA polymerase sigma factor (sigma-70 family)
MRRISPIRLIGPIRPLVLDRSSLKLSPPFWVSSSESFTRRVCTVPTEDATLVRRCLCGDTQAVRTLIERYQAEVYGLCVRVLNHRHDAEDVSQEVFLRIFRSLKRWDATRPLKPWIMGIAVNRCRTLLAQRSRRPELADYLQDTVPSPRADDSAELLVEIQAAVAQLRVEYRTVFVLFHEQGQPYEEIAQALERPVGTIKTWLHRARLEILERLKLRGMVAPDEEDVGASPAKPLP